jgi:hypothetical protein
MEAKRMGWERGVMTLLVATAFGCGSGDIAYHSPSENGSGGAGGSGDGGDGGASSGGDAACTGQCVPLGPGEWLGPMLLWIGKGGDQPVCPPSAPVDGATVFAELNTSNVCGTCKCDAPSGSCTLPATLTVAASACAGDGPNIPHTSFDASAGWSGDCSTANSIPANQKCNGADCVQSLTVSPLKINESPCGVTTTPVASKQPYAWGTVARTCRGAAFGPCASSVEVCTPPAPPGFAQCLLQKGDNDCPDTYPERHVFYKGFTDTRECTPCACSAPVGSTCSALVSVYKDAACSVLSGAVGIDSSSPACIDLLPSGQALGSKQATEPVYTPGVCQASGGEAIGAAVAEEPSTFCCLQ